MTLRLTALAATALLSLTTAPAFATSTKTWVSSTGADTGSCPLTAPCKTFQYAHDQTTAGGEIDVKDTGSYGQVMITKAISIVSGDGALAAVGVPSGGTGIDVKAGAKDSIVLQGLFIDGHGIGAVGINFEGGQNLTILNCHIRNVTGEGIYLQAGTFDITDSDISKVSNSTSGGLGIAIAGSSGSISRATVVNNDYGIYMGGIKSTVIDSNIADNGIGVQSEGGTLLIGQSTFTGNGTGLYNDNQGGVINSYGDNYINANSTDIFPSNGISSVARR